MTEPDGVVEHVHHGADGIKNVLTKKLGPLPGWAWALLVVAGAYGYYWYTNRTGSAVDTSQTADGSASGTDAISADGSGLADSLGDSGNDGGSTVTATETNDEWAAKAVAWAIAHGHSATGASNAVEAYLNQSPSGLTTDQITLINQIIRAIGTPPEGVLSVHAKPAPKPPVKKPPVKPTPPTKPKPPPATKAHKYTTVEGDTLISLAKKFYGTASDAHIEKLRVANVAHLGRLAANSKIPRGTIITVPK